MVDSFPLKLLLLTFAGLVNRDQSRLIAYLLEENRVFRELQGKKRPRLDRRSTPPPRSQGQATRPAHARQGRWDRHARHDPQMAPPTDRRTPHLPAQEARGSPRPHEVHPRVATEMSGADLTRREHVAVVTLAGGNCVSRGSHGIRPRRRMPAPVGSAWLSKSDPLASLLRRSRQIACDEV